MRQFYVYGFRSRSEYDRKSARSYDNERRRVESWLGNFMRFRRTAEGRQVWPLIRADYSTPLENPPTMPLTTLQKRWLKAILSDPRIQLFDPPMEGLEDVEPL